VESTEGVGSTFWFTLELEPGTPATKAVQYETLFQDRRALVVAPLGTQREFLASLLRAWGFEVVTALNGQLAFQLIRAARTERKPYDLLLLDGGIEDVSLVDLAQRAKKEEDGASTDIIALTSIVQKKEIDPLIGEVFCDSMIKPVKQLPLYASLICLYRPDLEASSTELVMVMEENRLKVSDVRLRVLVADDNMANQMVAQAILQRLGHRADVAANGREAVEVLRAAPYDLVLMDCQMPEMDGYEATRQIRSAESGVLDTKVPIIALTANVTGGNRERCLEAGMDDFLSKPIQPQQLAEIIQRWHKGGAKPMESAPLPPEPTPDESILWDEAELRDRYGDDDSLIRELMGVFMQDLPERMQELRQAFEAGEVATAERLSHMIKGSSATIGSPALMAVARRMEDLTVAGQLTEATALLSEMEQRFLALQELTKAKLGDTGTTTE